MAVVQQVLELWQAAAARRTATALTAAAAAVAAAAVAAAAAAAARRCKQLGGPAVQQFQPLVVVGSIRTAASWHLSISPTQLTLALWLVRLKPALSKLQPRVDQSGPDMVPGLMTMTRRTHHDKGDHRAAIILASMI